MAEKEYIERETAMHIVKCTCGDYATAFSMIRKLHAAGVAPVRHGHWINENFYTRCSVCNNMAIYDKYGQEVESDYCPHCGARMDGGEGE